MSPRRPAVERPDDPEDENGGPTRAGSTAVVTEPRERLLDGGSKAVGGSRVDIRGEADIEIDRAAPAVGGSRVDIRGEADIETDRAARADGGNRVDTEDETDREALAAVDGEPRDTRSAAEIETDLRSRLLTPGPTDRLWGWIGPLLVTAVAAVLRLVNLNHPTRLMFDETYYVKQAYSLLTLGYEGDWTSDDANDRFREGDFSDLSTEADYVVHPPVGKWLIALGMRAFGTDNGAGWRIAAALAGIVSVLLVARIGRRLFGSTLLGMAAGLLLAVDGLHLTESRIGLLDVFLMLFVVAAFGAVLLDRQRTRGRLAARCAADLAARGDGRLSDPWGPSTGIRWWLVLAGVLLGLASGVKWSGIYVLAVLGLTVLVWDICARRAVGARLWFGAGVFRGGFPAFFALVPTAALTYLASWWSWFATPGSYLRSWAADQVASTGEVVRSSLPPALNSWWEYHLRMWDFHNGLDSEHTYEAHPAGWIIQIRPTSFYWQDPAPGNPDCGAERCIQAITSVGNPVVWWLGAAAVLVVLWAALRHRDWRAWAVLAGYAGTYLPWFAYTHRTIFTFYAVALVPFIVLALVFAIAWASGMLPPLPRATHRPPKTHAGATATGEPVDATRDETPADEPAAGHSAADQAYPVRAGASRMTERRGSARASTWGAVVLATVVVAAVVVAAYFWPVWTGQTLTYDSWHMRMWLPTWI